MRTPIAWLISLLLAFGLGAAGGYVVKAGPAAAPASHAAACPAGTHPVVWYSAGSWACVSNS